MKLIVLLLLPCFLVAATPGQQLANATAASDAYVKDQYQLTQVMEGGICLDRINNFGRGYKATYEADLTKARAMIVDIASRYINTLMTKQELKKYLCKGFNSKDFLIDINFKMKQEDSKPLDNQVKSVLLFGNVVHYTVYTHGGSTKEQTEPFDQAVALVKAANRK
jgi:hypothetical protein